MDRGAWQATSAWGRKELDTTERLTFSLHYEIITNCDVKYCQKSKTNALDQGLNPHPLRWKAKS